MKVIELQYLPQPKYIALLLQEQELEIDLHEHYVKQSYRNRCCILTSGGVDVLSVPVLDGSKKITIKDIRIDYSQKWLNRHWRAIQSAYGKAPFFEFYADDIKSIYARKPKFLFDLSLELLTQCLKFLDFTIDLKFTSTYLNLHNLPENDFRSKINPKSNLPFFNSYKQVVYQQVFGSKFVDNLSVIDLIFCEGPQAGEIIKSGINYGTH